MVSSNKGVDWLQDYMEHGYACDFPDILELYTLEFFLSDKDIELDIDNNFLDLPEKALGEESTFKQVTDSTKPSSFFWQKQHSMDIKILARVISHCRVFTEIWCRDLAARMLSHFGTLEHALRAMKNPQALQRHLGLDSARSHLLRTAHIYATALAFHCVTTPAPAIASGHNKHGAATLERSLRAFGRSDRHIVQHMPPTMSPETAAMLLRLLDRSEYRPEIDVESRDGCSLATDRDILIGVWWVYWSMKKLRDSLVSSAELSFLWDVLTNRTSANMTWLAEIRRRCKEGYEPEEVKMVILPKSSQKTHLVPVISLGDKVALMALYASCYGDMERNDRASPDYSYKYPSQSKLDTANSLKYIPRAFWYSYLSNYLKYKENVTRHLDQGLYVFKTDISNFVRNIKPELLRDSMKMQGYNEKVSRAIYRFHRSWNDQDNRIGIPFGSSLTTAGMKIVLFRISTEMNARGVDKRHCFYYADDFSLVGETLEDAILALRTFDQILAELGLQRNLEKTHLCTPGSVAYQFSIDAALEAACAEMGKGPYWVDKKGSNAKAFEVPESLTLGGETEPALDFDVKLMTVPSCVIKILYLQHVKPYLDREEMPDKGIAGYTLYRMIKLEMPEAEEAILRIYYIAPHMQAKILEWLSLSKFFHKRVIHKLFRYYDDPRRLDDPWVDYSRSIFVRSIYKANEHDQSFLDKHLYSLLVKWWLNAEAGYLTRRELQHLAKFVDFPPCQWSVPLGLDCADTGF